MTDTGGWSSPDDQAGRPQDPPRDQQQPGEQQPNPSQQQASPGQQPYPDQQQPYSGQQPYPDQQPYSGQQQPYAGQQPYPGQQPYGGQQPYPGQQQPYPMPPHQQWGQPPSPKPGVIPLRPLGLGEILDGAISAIRAYPKQMLGVSAVLATVLNLLIAGIDLLIAFETDWYLSDLPLNASDTDRLVDQLSTALTTGLPAIIITLLISTVANGMLTVVMGKAVLGQPVTGGEAWQHIKPRLGALFGLSVLYLLIVTVGTLLLVIPGIWLYALLSLASAALILEGATVGQAFSRSRLLVTGAWWRTFGILVLAMIMARVLEFIVALPFGLITGGLFASGSVAGEYEYVVLVLITALAGIIAQTIVLPFTAGVTALIYIDRRMRREGMDIELARQAGVTPPPQYPPTAW